MDTTETAQLQATAMHLSVTAKAMHDQWKSGESPRIQHWLDLKRAIDQYDAAALPFVSRPTIMRDIRNHPILASSLNLWQSVSKIHYEWRHAIFPDTQCWNELEQAINEYQLNTYELEIHQAQSVA